MRTYEVVFYGEDKDVVKRKFICAGSEVAACYQAMRGEYGKGKSWKTVEATQVGG